MFCIMIMDNVDPLMKKPMNQPTFDMVIIGSVNGFHNRNQKL